VKCRHLKYLKALITFANLGFYWPPRGFKEQENMFIYFKGTGDNLLKGTLTKNGTKTMEKKRGIFNG